MVPREGGARVTSSLYISGLFISHQIINVLYLIVSLFCDFIGSHIVEPIPPSLFLQGSCPVSRRRGRYVPRAAELCRAPTPFPPISHPTPIPPPNPDFPPPVGGGGPKPGFDPKKGCFRMEKGGKTGGGGQKGVGGCRGGWQGVMLGFGFESPEKYIV